MCNESKRPESRPKFEDGESMGTDTAVVTLVRTGLVTKFMPPIDADNCIPSEMRWYTVHQATFAGGKLTHRRFFASSDPSISAQLDGTEVWSGWASSLGAAIDAAREKAAA